MSDRRKLDRSDVDLAAYIFGDGGSRRCRVFNISENGAGIELPTKLYMPATFKLMLERDRIIRVCRLVWSGDTRIGVVFKID
ncbi:PilZ domain-containing protein [Bradyrhizobium sp. 44]|uniref:PilZ domain-containing protein n=1 Tax=unclassified Bradyrhizobium TaxID=2631580 RepID=UPI00068817BE|nr:MULTISPECIES: PilZ domain-containing protein [unclassified Bradyrhizobium]MCK1284349.1 PilZ domain-containing protein [Bradyrhizobium sp. 44]